MEPRKKMDARGVTVLLQRWVKEYEIVRDGLAAIETINGLEEVVRSLEGRKKDAEAALVAMNTDRERALARLESQTLAALEDQRVRLARDKDVYQQDVDRLQAERARLTSAITAARSEAHGLTEANKRLKATIQMETDALRKQYDTLKADYEALRKQVIG